MAKRRTWKVVRWERKPEKILGWLPMQCENCGHDAECPHGDLGGAVIIAGGGMGVVFDDGRRPPRGWVPDEVQCRKCRAIFSDFGNPTLTPSTEVHHVG